jgi:3-oxoacyl-[acyl-carrier-protein] synthase II
MLRRRIVITGLGAITPVGVGVKALVEAIRQRRSGVRPIQGFDRSEHLSRISGQAPPFDPSAGVRKDQARYIKKMQKVMAVDIQMGVAAANQAVLDTGLPLGDLARNEPILPTIDHTRFGMVFGTNFIATDLADLALPIKASHENGSFSLEEWGSRGIPQMFPLWLLKYLPNMHTCHTGILWDAQGPSNSLTCSDAGGLLALDECVRILNRGVVDWMLGGGAESRVSAVTYLRHNLLNRLTKIYCDPATACRPFDADANGTVAAEGAVILMLEGADMAEARGARIYGEILGTGAQTTTAGVNACDPDGRAVAGAVTSALRDAGVEAKDLGVILAHGTGLGMQDRSEAAGLAAALGDAAREVPVTATKGVTGNLAAASGVADLAAMLVMAKDGLVPPIVNCDRAGERVRLNLVIGRPQPLRSDLVLATTNAIGGQAAAIVVRVSR